jgi:hypothetical protein
MEIGAEVPDAAAVRMQAEALRRAVAAARLRFPSGDWAGRQEQAIDACRVLAVFLRNHPRDPVGLAIVAELARTTSV